MADLSQLPLSSSEEEDCLIVIACLGIVRNEQTEKKIKKRRQRSVWIRPWIQRREEFGAYRQLLQELAAEDQQQYRSFLRMDVVNFQILLEMITPLIKRQDTHMWDVIPPGERLAVTLRFLASGNRFRDLQYLYRIPPCTLSKIVHETCQAIHQVLKQNYLQVPKTQEEWQVIARGFERRWNFPNCIGALDGKHVAIRAPTKEGSTFYNYKHMFSDV